MSGAERRASLDERVSWTTGFTRAADKIVLGALAFYADFESGRNARPGMHKLVARADLPKRTVERSLRRLWDEGWIEITDTRHLGATTYAIRLERLATSRAQAKIVAGRALSANVADTTRDPLSANLARLSANLAAAVRHSGGRTRDQYPGSSTQVHRRAAPASQTATADDAGAGCVRGDDDGLATTEGPTLAERDADVRTDGRDRPGRDPALPAGRRDELERSDQMAPLCDGVHVSERGDQPSDCGTDERSRARVEPVQQTFGPIALDVNARRAALVTLGDVWRAAIAKKPRAASS